MTAPLSLKADSPQELAKIGQSLKRTVYTKPCDIFMTGELGSGKTTFLQGFFRSFGIEEHITSPTYALEHRHTAQNGEEILHIDLYRLDEVKAAEFLRQTDDHEGIRCIEWSNRVNDSKSKRPRIDIHIADHQKDRTVTATFSDIRLPTNAEIDGWRAAVSLPEPIIRHCDAVGALARKLGDYLLTQGQLCRPDLLEAAGRVHDLLRFIDFKPGAAHVEGDESEEDLETWKNWGEKYAGLHHERACATLLRENGYDAMALVVETHGLQFPPMKDATVEQQLLFYADKRVLLDKTVSVKERFEDFAKRYAGGKTTTDATLWKTLVETIESDLFPKGIPF